MIAVSMILLNVQFPFPGKALCLLNKNDLSERCSGAGDVIHNILQLLVREASGLGGGCGTALRWPH